MIKLAKTKTHFGCFKAEYLWALWPFVKWHVDGKSGRMPFGIIFLEPAPAGGVFIGAATPHAMAILHDPDGHATSAMTLDFPDAAFAAAERPKPLEMTYCGERYAVDLPEWAQPGLCYVHDSGTFIQPKMRHPQWAEEDDEFYPCLFTSIGSTSVHRVGTDFMLTPGAPVDWRKVYAKAVRGKTRDSANPIAVSPHVVNLFSRIHEMFTAKTSRLPRLYHRPTTDGDGPGATVVTIEICPEFAGLYMPMRESEAQAASLEFLKRVHDGPETRQ